MTGVLGRQIWKSSGMIRRRSEGSGVSTQQLNMAHGGEVIGILINFTAWGRSSDESSLILLRE